MGSDDRHGGLPPRPVVGQPGRGVEVVVGHAHAVDGHQSQFRSVFPVPGRELPVVGSTVAVIGGERGEVVQERRHCLVPVAPCGQSVQ